jgi:TetR/AcrR family transcriptional repressor of nem operon
MSYKKSSEHWRHWLKVTREAAAETRRRIIEVAGRLFREKGFDGIGVADIMKQAGLTHGGFYGHFDSKDDLAAAAFSQAPASSARVWDQPPAAGSRGLTAFLNAYLSPVHRDNAGDGCALAALGSDVAREPLAVRAAFTAVLRNRLDILAGMLPGRNKAAQQRKALATLAGVVGALTLARAVADPALSNEILAATREAFGA